MMNIPAVCITLDRQNKSRAVPTMAEIRKLGFSHAQFLSGVDAGKMSRAELQREVSVRAWQELTHGREVHEAIGAVGAVGCSLAHFKAWEMCVRMNSPLAVFEDDMQCEPNAAEELVKVMAAAEAQKYDILRLYWGPTRTAVKALAANPLLCTSTLLQSSAAYIITPHAARTLLSSARPIEMHVDYYMSCAANYHQLKEFAAHRPLCRELSQSRSVIQHDRVINSEAAQCRRRYRIALVIVLLLACAFFFSASRK